MDVLVHLEFVPVVDVLVEAVFLVVVMIVRLHISRVRVLMEVLVAVLMAMHMRMFVGVSLSTMRMLVGMRVDMLVLVGMPVLVFSFHVPSRYF